MSAPRGSLRGKIFASILIASLLPFLGAVWLLSRAGEEDLREAALAEAQTAGTLSRALAQERSSRLLALAQAVALTPGVGDAIAARDRDGLLQLTRPWTDSLGSATLALTDERGTMVLRTYAPDRFGDDGAASTKGLLPALRGEPGFSTETAGLRGLAIRGFGPVTANGRVVGVATVTQNLDQEFLTGLRTAAGFETFAIFPDGSVVGASLDVPAASEIVRRGTEHTSLARVAGRGQAVHTWPLTDPDSRVVGFLGVVFPLESILAARARVRQTAAASGMVAVLAASVLAWLLSQAVVHPVVAISRAARTIAGGEEIAIPSVRSGDELEELSSALASMVGTLSEQAHRLRVLNERLTHERTRAEALAEASRALGEARLDLDAVLAALARRMAELFDGGCVVRMLSEDGLWLTPVAFHHTDPEALAFWQGMLAAPHRATDGINGMVARTGESRLLPRLTPEEARATILPEHWPFLERFGIRSLLVVPLAGADKSIGTLAVQRTTPDRPLGEEDRAFLEDVAGRASLAIDNARLYAGAQAALRARDDFLSIAAHELKTPATTVRATSQVMLRRLQRDGTLDADRVSRAMQTIDQQTAKLAQLVEQLLDVSRLGAGRFALERRPTDLVALVRSAAEAAQERTTQHRIKVELAPHRCMVQVDSLRVEQVLTNLLDNAIKYSPNGGDIEVTATPCEGVGDSASGGSAGGADLLRVTVRDWGLGVPPDRRDRIFDRYFRAHAEHHYSGMGLGLSISREIVELHGGTIRGEFPSDGGTRMVVDLPTQ